MTTTATQGPTRTVIDAIDRLEEMVNTGRRIPLTPSVVLNEELALDLIDNARLQLPDDLTYARSVLDERQSIIDEAETAAEEILARARADAEQALTGARAEAEAIGRTAEERAQGLVADHKVLGAAKENAAEMLTEAHGEAGRIRAEADAYARQVLERLSADLDRVSTSVRNGLDALPPSSPKAPKRHRPG